MATSKKRLLSICSAIFLLVILSGSIGYTIAESSWVPPNIALDDFPSTANFVIKADTRTSPTTYYAVASNGSVCFSSTNTTYTIQQTIFSMKNGGTIVISQGLFTISNSIILAPSAIVSGHNIKVIGEGNATIKAVANFPQFTIGKYPMFVIPVGSSNIEITGLTFDTNGPLSALDPFAIYVLDNCSDVKIHHNTHINTVSSSFAGGESAGFVTVAGSSGLDSKAIIITDNTQYLPVLTFTVGSWFANLIYAQGVIVSNNYKIGMDTFVRSQESSGINIIGNTIYGLNTVADLQGNNSQIYIISNQQHKSGSIPTVAPFTNVPLIYMRAIYDNCQLVDINIHSNYLEGDGPFSSGGSITGIHFNNDSHANVLMSAKISHNTLNGTAGIGIGMYWQVAPAEVQKIDVTDNTFEGTFAGALFIDGGNLNRADLNVKNNYGWVDENYGTATISSSTTVTINHGLSASPDNIQVTPITAGYGDFKVENPTTSQFTITVSNSGTF